MVPSGDRLVYNNFILVRITWRIITLHSNSFNPFPLKFSYFYWHNIVHFYSNGLRLEIFIKQSIHNRIREFTVYRVLIPCVYSTQADISNRRKMRKPIRTRHVLCLPNNQLNRILSNMSRLLIFLFFKRLLKKYFIIFFIYIYIRTLRVINYHLDHYLHNILLWSRNATKINFINRLKR